MIRRLVAAGALALVACQGRPPALATTLAAGEALFWRDQYDSARAMLQTALVASRASRDSVAEVRALYWLGRAAYGQGDYAAARRDGEASLHLALRWNLTGDLFSAWNGLGLLAWNQGRLVEAESLLTNAARAAALVGDHLSVGKASGNLGLVKVELGDFVGARAGLEAMLAAGRAAADPRVEGNALANLGMLDIREGDARSAVPRLNEARTLYQRIHYQAGQANLYGQLATAWHGLGDYQAAFAAGDSALSLARRLHLRQEEAANLEVIAMLHRESGDGFAALRHLEAAQAINRSLDLKVETGTDLRRVAEIRFDLGQPNAAVLGAKDALAIHAAVGAQPERLADLLFLARADTATSSTWLLDARRLADSLGTRRARGDVDLTAAELALARREWASALEVMADIRRSQEPADAELGFRIASAEMRAYAGARRWAEAEPAARRAVDAVERIRSSLNSRWTRARFLASRAGAFAGLVEILLADGRLDQAFTVADAVRGRALVEHLAGITAEDPSRTALLASFAVRERALRRITDLEQHLAAIGDDASPEAARTRPRLREQLVEQQAGIAEAARRQAASPRAAALLGGASVDVAAVQRVLAPGEALVEYLIGGERVHAFVISATAIHHAVLPVDPEDLATRVRVARDLVGRPGAPSAGWTVLGALHSLLVGPLRGAGWLKGVDRLLVVPHGVLSYLPFAALRDPLRGRYLIEDVAVTLVPSAATLVALRSQASPRTGAARVRALAPFPRQLPGTAAELAGIARIRPATDRLEGAAATEAAVRSMDPGVGVLHLATHGLLNPDNPLFSRMDLQASGPAAERGDGRLEVHEILGLEVRTPLVYLSGCETALGPVGVFTRGDDFVTLAQSFLFAGTRAVVATLWRIPDAGSAVLVELFYRNLSRADPGLALARAQRELIRSPVYSSPYYWAGHVLSGDTREADPGGPPTP